MKILKECADGELVKSEVEFSIVWITNNPYTFKQKLTSFFDDCKKNDLMIRSHSMRGFLTFVGTPD